MEATGREQDRMQREALQGLRYDWNEVGVLLSACPVLPALRDSLSLRAAWGFERAGATAVSQEWQSLIIGWRGLGR